MAKRVTDKERMDYAERSPLAMMVIAGRIADGRQPCDGANTMREAIDAVIRAEKKR